MFDRTYARHGGSFWAGLILLAACSGTGDSSRARGWLFDADPKWPGAIYTFDDASPTRFIGRCHGEPVFSLSGGDYPEASTPTFDFHLLVDGQRFTFEGSEGRHGRILVMEGRSTISALKSAKAITIEVGDWKRSLPGSPLIGRLEEACKTLRT